MNVHQLIEFVRCLDEHKANLPYGTLKEETARPLIEAAEALTARESFGKEIEAQLTRCIAIDALLGEEKDDKTADHLRRALVRATILAADAIVLACEPPRKQTPRETTADDFARENLIADLERATSDEARHGS